MSVLFFGEPSILQEPHECGDAGLLQRTNFGLGRASDLRAKFWAGLGKEISEYVIGALAAGPINDFDWQRRQGDAGIQMRDLVLTTVVLASEV